MTDPIEFRFPRPEPMSYGRAVIWEALMRELTRRYENTLTDAYFIRRRFSEEYK